MTAEKQDSAASKASGAQRTRPAALRSWQFVVLPTRQGRACPITGGSPHQRAFGLQLLKTAMKGKPLAQGKVPSPISPTTPEYLKLWRADPPEFIPGLSVCWFGSLSVGRFPSGYIRRQEPLIQGTVVCERPRIFIHLALKSVACRRSQ